jgi:hypothetical protein
MRIYQTKWNILAPSGVARIPLLLARFDQKLARQTRSSQDPGDADSSDRYNSLADQLLHEPVQEEGLIHRSGDRKSTARFCSPRLENFCSESAAIYECGETGFRPIPLASVIAVVILTEFMDFVVLHVRPPNLLFPRGSLERGL